MAKDPRAASRLAHGSRRQTPSRAAASAVRTCRTLLPGLAGQVYSS